MQFTIVRKVYSIVGRKHNYEIEWIAQCSLNQAMEKLLELQEKEKEDEWILTVAIGGTHL